MFGNVSRSCVHAAVAFWFFAHFATAAYAAASEWPKSLTLGTASPGGIFYVFGNDFAPVLTEKLGITVSHLPTQGSLHNVKLLDNDGVQLGIVAMGVAQQAWNGDGAWTGGKSFRNMRALFPMFSSDFQAVVLRKSGIQKLAELDKKRIGVGPRAAAGGIYIPGILKLLGVETTLTYGAFESMGTDLLTDRVDAIVSMISAPLPAILDVESKAPMNLLALSAEQMKQLRQAMPELSPVNITRGTYRSQQDDYQTIGSSIFLIARTELPDDLAYQLVKAAFESQPRLIKNHPAAIGMSPRNVGKNEFLPFHPGAVRYYRETGVQISESLIPKH